MPVKLVLEGSNRGTGIQQNKILETLDSRQRGNDGKGLYRVKHAQCPELLVPELDQLVGGNVPELRKVPGNGFLEQFRRAPRVPVRPSNRLFHHFIDHFHLEQIVRRDLEQIGRLARLGA